jgi:hypothetical protein
MNHWIARSRSTLNSEAALFEDADANNFGTLSLEARRIGCCRKRKWEYVTRAGTTTPFWWGSSITPEPANCRGHPYKGGGKSEVRASELFVLSGCGKLPPLEIADNAKGIGALGCPDDGPKTAHRGLENSPRLVQRERAFSEEGLQQCTNNSSASECGSVHGLVGNGVHDDPP